MKFKIISSRPAAKDSNRLFADLCGRSLRAGLLCLLFLIPETITGQHRLLNDATRFLITGRDSCSLLPDSIIEKISAIHSHDVFTDLIVIAGDSMEGRGIGTKGYARASLWLENEFRKIGILPGVNGSFRQPFSVLKKQVAYRTHFYEPAPDTLLTWNLTGIIPGTDPLLKDEIIVLTAHLDHIGRTKDSVFYGANDNASGVAVMLNAAKFITRNPLKRTLAVIAFSGEECGLLGSSYFVNDPVFDLEKIVLLINLDIVGSGHDGLMLQGGERYTFQQSLIELVNRRYFSFQLATRPNSANSDHYYFNIAGVPAMFIYTFNGTCPYHLPGDHPRCIDPITLANVTRFISAVTWFFGTNH